MYAIALLLAPVGAVIGAPDAAANGDSPAINVSDMRADRAALATLAISVRNSRRPVDPIGYIELTARFPAGSITHVETTQLEGLPAFWYAQCVLVGSDQINCLVNSQNGSPMTERFGLLKVGLRISETAPSGTSAIMTPLVNVYSIAGAPLPRTVTAGTLTICASPNVCRQPVVFVPGIMGSRLAEFAESPPSVVWFPTPVLDAFGLGRKLSLYPEDDPVPPNPDAKDIRATDALRREYRDVYDGFLRSLSGSGGYKEYTLDGQPERLTTAGCDVEQRVGSPTLFVFPYDWRRSNAENGRRLGDYIGCIRRIYPGTRVNIVAHSMGGLLVRRYLLDNVTAPVDAVITVGTPWLGAPMAIDVLDSGRILPGNFFSIGIRYASPSLPAVAELLPTANYGQVSAIQTMVERGFDFDGNGSSYGPLLQPDVMRGLARRFPRPSPGIPERHRTFHNHRTTSGGQSDWRADPSPIRYEHIVGVQSRSRTIVQVDAHPGLTCIRVNLSDVCVLDQSRLVRRFGVGDGTVPACSALRMGRGSDLNAPAARLHLVRGDLLGSDDHADHGKMLQATAVQNAVVRLLAGVESGLPLAERNGTLRCDRPQFGNRGPTTGEAYFVDLAGSGPATITDPEGRTLDLSAGAFGEIPDVSAFTDARGDGTIIFERPGESAFSARFAPEGRPVAIQVVIGPDQLNPTRVLKWADRSWPAPARLELRLPSVGTPTLWLDDGADGVFEAPVTPSHDISGPASGDTEGPVFEVRQTVRPGRFLVSITARDAISAVASVNVSSDGQNFRAYEGPFEVSDEGQPTVYLFADDSVGNRSTAVVQLTELISRLDFEPIESEVSN